MHQKTQPFQRLASWGVRIISTGHHNRTIYSCIFHFVDNELIDLGSDTPTFKVGVYFESNEPGYFVLELSRPHLCWYIVSARVCALFALSRVRVRVDQIE